MNTAALDKSINYFLDQIKFIHASGGSNIILEEIRCDVYNSKMKIRELGTVNSLGGGSYAINLWDPSIGEFVKSAIMNTINLNAQLEGGSLKVNFPTPTQEKRHDLTKIISKNSEDCLIAIRNIRRDEISTLDKQLKDKEITEDDKKSQVNKIEAIIKEYSKKIEDIKLKKITEINTI